MRLTNIVMTYLLIGVVMLGGGAIAYDDVGVVQTFVDYDQSDESFSANENATSNVEDTGGVINGVISLFGGPLKVVWELFDIVIAYLNWPIFVFASNNAPPMLTLILGVPLTAGFYLSLIRLVKSSA